MKRNSRTINHPTQRSIYLDGPSRIAATITLCVALVLSEEAVAQFRQSHLAENEIRPIRISLAPDGEQGDGASSEAAVSADGRLVVFRSEAENLAPEAGLGLVNVLARSIGDDGAGGFSLDVTRAIGAVWDDSGAELSSAVSPVASADGSRIAFRSSVGERYGTGSPQGLFVFDSESGATIAVDRGYAGDPPNGISASPSISADGTLVAFHSWANNLVPGDDNGRPDVFVHDLVEGMTQLISRSRRDAEADSRPADGASLNPWLAGGGNLVVFESDASDLVVDDSNRVRDIFAFDLGSGTMQRISVGAGAREATRDSHSAVVSADGRFVAFASDAGELSPSAVAGAPAIHLYDRSLGLTTLVSMPFDGSVWGLNPDDAAEMPAISPDGRFVAFSSTSRRITPEVGGPAPALFVFDRHRAHWLRVGQASDDPGGDPPGSVIVTRGALGDGALVFSTDLPLEESDTNTVADVYAVLIPSSVSAPRVILPWLGSGS